MAVFLFLDACQVNPYAQEGTRTHAAHNSPLQAGCGARRTVIAVQRL
jgi:hypothetical protein